MAGRGGLGSRGGVGAQALTSGFQMSWQILSGTNYRVYLLLCSGCLYSDSTSSIGTRATCCSAPLSGTHLTLELLHLLSRFQHLFKTLFMECHWRPFLWLLEQRSPS